MKYLSFVLTFVILIASVSAIDSLGTFRQYDCISLKQTCANCSAINFTSVILPNSSIGLGNVAATKLGTEYNYTFCRTDLQGNYIVNGVGDIDGTNTIFAYNFEVTATGTTLSTSKSITYILIWIISFMIFAGLLFVGLTLPSKNNTDEMTGYILAVSNLKYFKMLCIALSYVVLIFISYFSWMMCYAYLDMGFLSTIFQFGFYILVGLTLPLFIVGIFIVISNWVNDQKIGEMLSRGLHTK
jgi:hypothetical protein